MAQEDFLAILNSFPRQHDLLIAFDSDGCVFDTMTLKQTRVFHPMTMEFWQLWPIETYVRETAEFFNLFSQDRGKNRFLTQSKLFRTLRGRPDVAAVADRTGLALPDPEAIDVYTDNYDALGDSTLREFVTRVSQGETFEGKKADIWSIHKVLGWSEAINRIMPFFTEGVEPYPHVRECLAEITEYADALVVSQTPVGALRHEWKMNSIDGYVKEIAGQEMGKKWQHLQMAIENGRYESGKVLMVGDADGDLDAAKKASD
ncbi:MAG: HAD hydrolase-like protein, partial [Armatimonadetes bacterium]|nr:HAD hydrolase-like protein [Armatimonadota bacterium]